MLAVAVSILICCKNQVDDLLKIRVFLYCADMLQKAKSYDVNTWAQKTYIYVNTWVIIQPVQCSLAFLKMHRYCDVLKADIFGWLAYCEIMRLFQWDNSSVSCSVWELGFLCRHSDSRSICYGVRIMLFWTLVCVSAKARIRNYIPVDTTSLRLWVWSNSCVCSPKMLSENIPWSISLWCCFISKTKYNETYDACWWN